LSAGGNVRVIAEIHTSGGNINITSGGNIDTEGGRLASNSGKSGSINLNATGNILTDEINAASSGTRAAKRGYYPHQRWLN
jgi:hypothetical protein